MRRIVDLDAIQTLAVLIHDRAHDVAEWLIDLGVGVDDLLAELPLNFRNSNYVEFARAE
jgi:hypothetical protein